MTISSRHKRQNSSAAWSWWVAWHLASPGGFHVSRGCWSSDSLRALFRSLTCTSLQHINKPNTADKFIIYQLRYVDLTRFVSNRYYNIIHSIAATAARQIPESFTQYEQISLKLYREVGTLAPRSRLTLFHTRGGVNFYHKITFITKHSWKFRIAKVKENFPILCFPKSLSKIWAFFGQNLTKMISQGVFVT